MIDGSEISDEIPLRYRKAQHGLDLEQVQKVVAREWNVPVATRGGDDKKAAIYLAKKATGMGGREVGAAFGVKPAQVSHIVRGIDDEPESTLARRIHRLRQRLNT